MLLAVKRRKKKHTQNQALVSKHNEKKKYLHSTDTSSIFLEENNERNGKKITVSAFRLKDKTGQHHHICMKPETQCNVTTGNNFSNTRNNKIIFFSLCPILISELLRHAHFFHIFINC